MEAIVRRPRLIGFGCFAVFLAGVLSASVASAETAVVSSRSELAIPPAQLVREVVYNELHEHESHGYWRYWIEKHAVNQALIEEQVETQDGPVTRVQLMNGHTLSGSAQQDEDRRLQHLLTSPSEQAQHRKEYAEDEHRIGRILALLPDAFLYERVADQRLAEGDCYHLRFQPNPDYPAHSIESRIFHAMSGDLWISIQSKHLVRLDGRLQQNVDFGFGILGRLYKDGWFRLERTRATTGTGPGEWKTKRLEVHMIGRAMLFKTIARETSEVRGGFEPVPMNMSLQQAVVMTREPLSVPAAVPVSLVTSR